MASLAGAAAALILLSTPVGLLEMIVASAGLSESFPAAAPPLGLKARAIMAIFTGLMAFGLVAALSRRTSRAIARIEDKGRMKSAVGESIMGFALSKLTALARGRAGPVKTPIRSVPSAAEEQPAPALRRADAHPDAPARAPIFASRDFGGLDIFPRVDDQEAQIANPARRENPVEAPLGLPLSTAPAPLSSVALRGPFDAVPEAVTDLGAAPAAFIPKPVVHETPIEEPTVSSQDAVRDDAPTHELSLSELTDRLERGLRARGAERQAQAAPASSPADHEGAPAPVLAALPPAEAVPVRASVADEVDGALRAALGTLRGITGRAR
ncbi:MAG: hypothetical protein ABW164_11655 [Sphingobium sp.]